MGKRVGKRVRMRVGKMYGETELEKDIGRYTERKSAGGREGVTLNFLISYLLTVVSYICDLSTIIASVQTSA